MSEYEQTLLPFLRFVPTARGTVRVIIVDEMHFTTTAEAHDEERLTLPSKHAANNEKLENAARGVYKGRDPGNVASR